MERKIEVRYSGRRVAVRAPPGRSLHEVLDDARGQLGLAPSCSGQLRLMGRALDLSLPVRLANLPSSASLEFVPSSASISSSKTTSTLFSSPSSPDSSPASPASSTSSSFSTTSSASSTCSTSSTSSSSTALGSSSSSIRVAVALPDGSRFTSAAIPASACLWEVLRRVEQDAGARRFLDSRLPPEEGGHYLMPRTLVLTRRVETVEDYATLTPAALGISGSLLLRLEFVPVKGFSPDEMDALVVLRRSAAAATAAPLPSADPQQPHPMEAALAARLELQPAYRAIVDTPEEDLVPPEAVAAAVRGAVAGGAAVPRPFVVHRVPAAVSPAAELVLPDAFFQVRAADFSARDVSRVKHTHSDAPLLSERRRRAMNGVSATRQRSETLLKLRFSGVCDVVAEFRPDDTVESVAEFLRSQCLQPGVVFALVNPAARRLAAAAATLRAEELHPFGMLLCTAPDSAALPADALHADVWAHEEAAAAPSAADLEDDLRAFAVPSADPNDAEDDDDADAAGKEPDTGAAVDAAADAWRASAEAVWSSRAAAPKASSAAPKWFRGGRG